MVYKGRLKKSQTWDIVPNSVPTPSEDRVSLRGNFLAGFLRLVKDAFRIKKKYTLGHCPKVVWCYLGHTKFLAIHSIKTSWGWAGPSSALAGAWS